MLGSSPSPSVRIFVGREPVDMRKGFDGLSGVVIGIVDEDPQSGHLAVRALRTVAVGRKSWVFFGNERGGQAAAVMYSLIGTCKQHGVDPRTYLRDVLLRIARVSDVRELTPYGWKSWWKPVADDHRPSILGRIGIKVLLDPKSALTGLQGRNRWLAGRSHEVGTTTGFGPGLLR